MYKIPEEYMNKYRFVTLAALRGEQLQMGARPRIDSPHQKPTLIAQEEVAEGVIAPWDPAAAEAELEAAEVETQEE